jgi:hypothetical protein
MAWLIRIDMDRRSLRAWLRVSTAIALVAIFAAATSNGARADDSAALLKAMADYTAAQKSITATFDSDIEVITPELPKDSVRELGPVENDAARQAARQTHR